MKYESEGVLRYSAGDNYWLVVDVDQGIVDYARALVPKPIRLNRQKFSPHITVVRNEIPKNLEFWRKYNGEKVLFSYSTYVNNDDIYWWLNANCNRLEDIRNELGLNESSEWTRPPDNSNCFHITIGNTKKI